jgi:7-cyano-7-deazaguanine reductase
MTNITDKIAAKYLGKKIEGYTQYDPTILVGVPREENRKHYDIKNEDLPFEGEDIWHAYEFSTMTKNSIPISRVLKLKYSCKSKYIVESKSLKLYLNSFNMSKFGSTTKDCLNICKNLIQTDLSKKLETEVKVEFLSNETKRIEIFTKYTDIINYIDEKSLKIEKFKEAPETLETEQLNEVKEYLLKFDSLRSNCRVTHQPDFGEAFIFYKSKKHIKESSLVKYLTSFRSEFHFHEECCEMIFKRLSDILDKEDKIMVCALYTRRGGIDICPFRTSKDFDLPDIAKLSDITKYARNGIKQ